MEADWKQNGRRLEVDWKKNESKLEGNWKETGIKVVVLDHLSFQHHDVKDSSIKGSRFEKKLTEIKTTKHLQ